MDRTRIARRLGGAATRQRRHRRMALAGILLVVVAALLIVVGGGDDDEGDGGEVATGGQRQPTTVAEVCEVSNEDLAIAQQALLSDNQTRAAIIGFLGDAFVDRTRARAESIRALDPPAEVLDILADHDAVVDAIEADPEAAATLENPFAAVNERWREAGLDVCVIDPGTVAG